MTANIILIIVASGLSGFAISIIGQTLNVPPWLIVTISAVFGWFLAGTLTV